MKRTFTMLMVSLVVIGAMPLMATIARADESEAWDKISGIWVVDYDATAELIQLTSEERSQILGTKEAGVRIMLDVRRGEATLRIEAKETSTLTAEWKMVSEDSKGVFIESYTGNGTRMERVSITYLPNGSLKYEFGDMNYPLIFKPEMMDL